MTNDKQQMTSRHRAGFCWQPVQDSPSPRVSV